MSWPVKNAAFTFYVGLIDSAARPAFKANPTLAAGDVKVSTDGGAFANITTLPDAEPDLGRAIRVQMSQTEMNGNDIVVQFVDAAGAEWDDLVVHIQTTTRGVDDLAFPTTSGRSIDVTATGGVGIDWANVENPTTAVNLSATNIDVDQVIASVTGAVGSLTANNDKTGYALSATGSAALTEGYATDGAAATLPQLLYMIWSMLAEANAVSTTITTKKLDGATDAMTFTIDNATTPTTITRAT